MSPNGDAEKKVDSQPGHKALQWILSRAYSTATCFVNSTTAPLEAQYAAVYARRGPRPLNASACTERNKCALI